MLLHTLGELRLEGAHGALSSRRKELTLLAFVARRFPRSCTRDELSALLWEQRDRSRARQSLRQALLQLKRELGDALVVEGEAVSVNPGRLTLDIVAVEHHLEAGRLAQAVEEWRGEFLPGVEEVGGEALRGWLEGEREALRRRIRAAFARLSGDAARAGEWAVAVGWSERWAAAFPLDEGAHIQLAESLKLSGRQAAAVSRLAAFSARVQVELGVAPSAALTAIQSSLGRPLFIPGRSSSLGSSALFTPDVVGRSSALAELAAAWAEAKTGTSVAVVVEAESGMGRTRLVEEFVRRVRRQGDAVLLYAKGRRAGEPEPWSGIRELLDGIVSAGGLAGANADALSALAAVAPALRVRFPFLTPREATANDQQAALADVLGAVADEHPVTIVLDDLTHLDAPSLRLIAGALANQIRHLLLIVTVATNDPATPGALEELRALGTIRRLKLSPLTTGDLEALLESMLQLAPTDRRRLAERLYEEGRGSPFYAVEMTSALVDEGLLVATDEGGWGLAGDGDWSFPRPASIREALTRRLCRLPAPARGVAEAAAMIRGDIGREALRLKSGMPAETFEEALEELVAAKIIRPFPAGDRYEFTQDMTAGVVVDLMSPERREALAASAHTHLPRGRWWIAAAAALTAAAVFIAVRAYARPALDHGLALAAPLRNETGDPTLDPIGDLAADWITQGIAQSGVVHVVAPQTVRATLHTVDARRPAPNGEMRVEALARETGAGTVVSGSYYRAGDSLMFQLRITDASTGRVLSAPAPIRGSAADPTLALEQVRERAVGALGLLFGARLSGMNQNASRPPSYAAYKEFVEGLDLHLAYRYDEALRKYRKALAIDSTFGSPVVWSALAYWSMDDFAHCDSMLRIADRLTDQLSPFDALLAANQRGELHGDYAAALAAAREMTRVSSGAEGFILVGQEALRLNRPHEAVVAFRRADPDRGWIKGWEGYWGYLAYAYHNAGDLEAALKATQEGHRRYPSSPFQLTDEAMSLAALDRADALDAIISEALSRRVDPDWPPSITMFDAAVELRAHGHPDLAREMALRGMRNRRAIPGPPPRFMPDTGHPARLPGGGVGTGREARASDGEGLPSRS